MISRALTVLRWATRLCRKSERVLAEAERALLDAQLGPLRRCSDCASVSTRNVVDGWPLCEDCSAERWEAAS